MDLDVPTRLLDAVEWLCADSPPSEVTMRRIATEAGVSLGLAYYYFGSKEELFGKALDRMAGYVAQGADPGEDPGDVLDELWRRLAARPAFPRLLSALVSDGKDVSAIMSGHPLVTTAAQQVAQRGHPDPAAAAGILALLALAGNLFGPMVNRAIGRDPEDAALYEAIKALLRPT